MTYEELKQSIYDFIKSKGFEEDEDGNLIHIEDNPHTIYINNIECSSLSKKKTTFECLGEGSIDDDIMIGFNLNINGIDNGDVWISNVEQLKQFINF